jgi:hypothetical protein
MDDDDDDDDDDLSHHPSDLNQVPLPLFPPSTTFTPTFFLSSRRGHAVIGSCRAWIGQFVKLLQQQSSKQSSNQSINPSSKQASNFVQKKNFTPRLQLRVVCNSETENMFDALCFLLIIFFMCNSSGD